MAQAGRPSAEQLCHDLGTALSAFVQRSASARRTAADVRSRQDSRISSTSTGFTGKHGVPQVHTTMLTAAADPPAAERSRTSTHVLPCRITQHGRPPVRPLAKPIRTDAGFQRPLPHLRGQSCPAPLASSSDSTDGLQCEIIVLKKTYAQYGQAPPSSETLSGLLTANLKVVKTDEAAKASAVSADGSDCTDREILYEKVAQRLDEIAAEINSKYFSEHGDQHAQRQLSSAISEIVQGVSTTSFHNAVNRVIPSTQPEMQQLALLYQLTAAAIHVVGTGSSQASRLADLCVHYAFDRFAAFIMAKGGLDLAIGDSDFEVD